MNLTEFVRCGWTALNSGQKWKKKNNRNIEGCGGTLLELFYKKKLIEIASLIVTNRKNIYQSKFKTANITAATNYYRYQLLTAQ